MSECGDVPGRLCDNRDAGYAYASFGEFVYDDVS